MQLSSVTAPARRPVLYSCRDLFVFTREASHLHGFLLPLEMRLLIQAWHVQQQRYQVTMGMSRTECFFLAFAVDEMNLALEELKSMNQAAQV